MRIQQLGIRRAIRKHRAMEDAKAISTHTSLTERRILYSLALHCPGPRNAVEIGSYLGSSSICIAAGLREFGGGSLVCVDTWQNETMPEGSRDTYREFNQNTRRYADVIRAVRKQSDCLVESDLPRQISFAFIDGDHSYSMVKNDVEKIAAFLLPGAVVAFHDSKYFPGVSKLIGELLASVNWQLLGAVDNLAWLKFIPDGVAFFGVALDGSVLSRDGRESVE